MAIRASRILLRNKKKKKHNVRAENSHYLFSGENSLGEPMFVCMHCGGPINGNQVATRYYYVCSAYKNKGKAGCDKGLYIEKDKLESSVLKALKKRFHWLISKPWQKKQTVLL
ncbi:MAG: zinc ribbon domain-containing protein [Dethiobacter sp.]|nr:zinc ribbon domain-containing protein [Dethiobacter sp.]